jgi:hypothetical protein
MDVALAAGLPYGDAIDRRGDELDRLTRVSERIGRAMSGYRAAGGNRGPIAGCVRYGTRRCVAEGKKPVQHYGNEGFLILPTPRSRAHDSGSPRSRAAFRFPGALGIVFDFPWLCRRGRGTARSLWPGIGGCCQKRPPSLWPRQTSFPAEFLPANRERFERRQRPVRVSMPRLAERIVVGIGEYTGPRLRTGRIRDASRRAGLGPRRHLR